MCPNAWYTGKCRAHFRCLRLLFVLLITTIALFPLSAQALTLQDLYKFNSTYGDSLTEETDDGGAGPINVSVSFPFFTKKHSKLYVNNNGVISFIKQRKDYTPADFPLTDKTPIIAPFWADVDVTKGGRVWYRQETGKEFLRQATKEVKRYFSQERNFKATWMFIATWDHVCFYGAAGSGENKTNTFQAVLITNGEISFVIFNYQQIEWTTGSNSGGDTTTGLGNNPAQAGFNAGDQKTYYEIQGARTEKVINLTESSNVNIPGKWCFKVDSALAQGSCTVSASGSVRLYPRVGSILGGYVVEVMNPCFNANDILEGRVDETNQTFPCEYVDQFKAKCVFPTIFKTGQLTFSLKINENGWNYTGSFQILNLDQPAGQVVRVNPENWAEKKSVEIKWDPSGIAAQSLKIELLSFTEENGPRFKNVSKLHVNERYKNSGSYQLTIPEMSPSGLAVIRISVSNSTNDSSRLLPISVWTDVFPIRSSNKKISQQICMSWMGKEKNLPNVTKSEPCPCTLAQAVGDTARYQPDPFCNSQSTSLTNCLYKPGAKTCLLPNYQGSLSNSEACCYDGDGELLDARQSNSGGGTRTRYHYLSQGDNIVPFFTFLSEDMLPSLLCCQYSINDTLCRDFLHYRPATTCEGYQPPAAAQAAGDPHLVTLDGKGYSFNSVGDFVLLQDKSKTLSVQVRAIQTKDIDGKLQRATIFSGVAMQVKNTSDLLEIHWSEDAPVEIFVNGDQRDLPATSQLNGFTVYKNDTGDNTAEMTIVMNSVGLSVMVSATEDLLNIMIVVGSPSLKGQLEGLLGNYNGNQNDDFVSRSGEQLSIEASMKEIHYKFGMSWAVSENDSLFSQEINLASVNATSFEPVFISDLNETVSEDTKKLCEDNKQCVFDYEITRKESVALSTKTFTNRFEERRKEIQAVVRCPYVDDIPNGVRNVSQVSKEGSTVTFKCNENYFLFEKGSEVLYCQKDGTWSGRIPKCVIKTPYDDKISIYIGIGVGVLVFLLVCVTILVKKLCWKKRFKGQAHKISGEYTSVELPEMFTPSTSDIPSPVFENPSFIESLQKLNSDTGRFKIPRPVFVDRNIYYEYF